MLRPGSYAPFRAFPAVHPFPKADASGYVLSRNRAQRQSERYLALQWKMRFMRLAKYGDWRE
jgi:hypothetical protein